jgi:hypothetical protein
MKVEKGLHVHSKEPSNLGNAWKMNVINDDDDHDDDDHDDVCIDVRRNLDRGGHKRVGHN